MNKFQKYFSVILAIAAIALQLLTPNTLGFHRDELLYFAMADHPAAGYYSVPPFTGLMAWLSTNLFGYTLISAKILPALAGGILVFLIAQLVLELKGGIYAQLLAVLSFVATILFIRAFSLFQPVPFDIMFWTILLYLFVRFINTRNPHIFFLMGFIAGLAFLNKYNIIFLIFSMFIAVFFSKYRKIFISRYALISAFIFLLTILPNLLWQYFHEFPVINHMQELRSSQLVNMDPITFIFEQVLMIMPASLIVFPAFIWIFYSKRLKEYRIIGWTSLIVLVLFILLRGKSYYSAGIYPALAAVGGVWVEKFVKNQYVRILPVAIMLFMGLWMFPMGKPVKPAELLTVYFDNMEKSFGTDAVRRDEDNRYNKLPQDYADMLGWEELAYKTAEVWRNSNPDSTIIYCENYGQAGAISVLGKRYHLPAPVSFSESFIYWAPRSLSKNITTLIYINDDMGQDVKDQFYTINQVDSISNPLAREFGTKVFLCTNPKGNFSEFYTEVTARMYR